ncbi:MAG TPA: ABC transporter permease [Gemmatimonadaceae bacterium]
MRPPSLRGFWKLTWVETKIFSREPMGFFATLLMPLALFVILGRTFGAGIRPATPDIGFSFNAAILAAVVIAINAVQSLMAIIAIYREGGILKRLRATPLSPTTILGAHVVVKLGFTAVSTALLIAAGRRMFPGVLQVNIFSFSLAVLLGTLSILSLGFVLASLVPTSRFAQPLGAVVLYPMLAISGLFYPVALLPGWLRVIAVVLPTTHAVALMQGVWDGSGWGAHWMSAVSLVVLFVVYATLSTRVFRWE